MTSKETDMNTFVIYRLKNQKNKGYKGLYSRLFKMLNADSIFGECYDEKHWYEGEDMIIVCSWGLEVELPKGITEYVYTEDSEVSIGEVREILKEYE